MAKFSRAQLQIDLILQATSWVGCCCLVALAPPPSAAGVESSATTPSGPTARLIRLLRPHVTVLDRDMVTFHYENSENKDRPTTLEQIQKKFLNARSFFRPEFDDSNDQGPGVYVAIDPIGSRDFGGWSDPQLYVFTIKAHARLLNTTFALNATEAAEIKSIADEARCVPNVYGSPDRFSKLTGFFRDNASKTCARTLVDAFTHLGIQAILYTYSASDALMDCRLRGEAINVISPEIIDPSSMSIFSRDVKIGSDQLEAQVASLYHQAARDYDVRSTADFPDRFVQLPRGLTDRPISAVSFLRWRNQNIFKCGAQWSAETLPPDAVKASQINWIYQRAIVRSYADYDLQTTLLQLKAAFKARRPPSSEIYFNATRINAVERRLYEASVDNATAAGFEQWKKMADAYDESLIGSPQLALDDIHFRARALRRSREGQALNQKQPALLWWMYRFAGLDPDRQLLAVNRTVVRDYGGFPILNRELVKRLGRGSALEIAANQALFTEILNQCAGVYADGTQSFAKIQSGACGIRNSGTGY